MKRTTWLYASVCLACLVLATQARAEVKPNPLFSDGVVLQRGQEVPVWGTADDGEKVTVSIQGKEAQATAKDGKWSAKLPRLKSGGPFEMTIKGSNEIVIKDVLVGEVWICSGQSNMAWTLAQSTGGKEAIEQSNDPMFHFFQVPTTRADSPADTVKGSWKAVSPETVGRFSGVGYFFGRDLRKALGVPVGLIGSYVGGTPAEAWTSKEMLQATPELKIYFDRDAKRIAEYPEAQEKFREAQAKRKDVVAQAKEKNVAPPPAPRPPYGPTSTSRPSCLYNGMIAPLEPFAFRGVIWYQGESNAGDAYLYKTLFSTMIKSWREAWGQGDFPFLFVQLAPFMPIVKEPAESGWAELREAQLDTSQSVPNTAMVVITDVGEERDIHPKKKEPVGARLALAARRVAYGESIAAFGPVYRRMEVEGDKAILHFRHHNGGLVAKDGPLTGFAIAGKDHKFVNAKAEIKDNTVVVWSDEVKEPVAVRYGWANFPTGNLWNGAGLPATPFRTDDFPMSTLPKSEKSERAQNEQPAAEKAAEVRELVYKKTEQGELKIAIHLPAGWKASDKRPAIVYFFGGGWNNGRIEQFLGQSNHLAARGLVAARADYRVKSRHNVTPERCVEDAKSAVRWLRAHAGEYGIDPNRIVAAGGSAGGHIAACTWATEGLEASGEDASISSQPNAMVLYNPVLMFSGIPQLVERVGGDESVAKQISPTLHVTKSMPPVLLLYGSTDRLLAQTDEFLAKAKDAGCRVELFTAEGVGHGFFNREPWAERTTARVDQFLESLGYLPAPSAAAER